MSEPVSSSLSWSQLDVTSRRAAQSSSLKAQWCLQWAQLFIVGVEEQKAYVRRAVGPKSFVQSSSSRRAKGEIERLKRLADCMSSLSKEVCAVAKRVIEALEHADAEGALPRVAHGRPRFIRLIRRFLKEFSQFVAAHRSAAEVVLGEQERAVRRGWIAERPLSPFLPTQGSGNTSQEAALELVLRQQRKNDRLFLSKGEWIERTGRLTDTVDRWLRELADEMSEEPSDSGSEESDPFSGRERQRAASGVHRESQPAAHAKTERSWILLLAVAALIAGVSGYAVWQRMHRPVGVRDGSAARSLS